MKSDFLHLGNYGKRGENCKLLYYSYARNFNQEYNYFLNGQFSWCFCKYIHRNRSANIQNFGFILKLTLVIIKMENLVEKFYL